MPAIIWLRSMPTVPGSLFGVSDNKNPPVTSAMTIMTAISQCSVTRNGWYRVGTDGVLMTSLPAIKHCGSGSNSSLFLQLQILL